jgi:hypothetical protein
VKLGFMILGVFLLIDYGVLLIYDGVFLVVVSPVVAGRIVVMCVDVGQWPCAMFGYF